MGTEEDARKLFVAGLPDTVTDEALRALFTGTGSGIDELSLPRDRATGRPRGFAFVTLTSAEEAQRAREQLDGSLMDGRSISVRPFSSGGPPRAGMGGAPGPGGGGAPMGERRPPMRDDSNRTLYVGNLPYDVEDQDLRSIFAQLGAQDLDRIHLPMDHATGRKRGFAFVSFVSEDAAKAALEVLGQLSVRGRPCTVHLAHPRGERPQRVDRGGGGFGGGGPPVSMRGSAPPPPMGGRGSGSFGPGPMGDRSGRPPPRRTGEEFERERGPKGMGKKKQLQEEKRRGGGNARRYMEDVDDDE